jgi:hypothetical protein
MVIVGVSQYNELENPDAPQEKQCLAEPSIPSSNSFTVSHQALDPPERLDRFCILFPLS